MRAPLQTFLMPLSQCSREQNGVGSVSESWFWLRSYRSRSTTSESPSILSSGGPPHMIPNAFFDALR